MTETPPQYGPRLERKHLLAESGVPPLVAWLRDRLEPDRHATDPSDPKIRIDSIYFDTPERLCYRGRSRVQLPKHRLRRYDGGAGWFMEEKLRLDENVWKRRLAIGPEELEKLLEGGSDLDGPLEWFRARFRMLRLLPVLHVAYDRRAFVGPGEERVTIDQQVEAAPIADESGDPASMFDRDRAFVSMTPQAVLEVKGPAEITPLTAEILEHLAIDETPTSKYSLGLEAIGLETTPVGGE